MDAIEFVKEYIRLCKQHPNCENCPLEHKPFCALSVKEQSRNTAEETVRLVEEWSAAYPYKTRQSEFLKLYPNAELDINGIIDICPYKIEPILYQSCDLNKVNCDNCCREFWTQEVE